MRQEITACQTQENPAIIKDAGKNAGKNIGKNIGQNAGKNGGTVPEKLSENEKETGYEYCGRILVRYSSAHLSRYAYIARGCRLLKAGDTTVVQSDENEKTCPVCHRALPGTRECPHCTKQKGGLVRFIWQYARNYKMLLTVTVILMLAATASTLIPSIWNSLNQ